MSFSTVLRRLMDERNVTAMEVANEIHVPYTTIKSILHRPEANRTDVHVLKALANYFNEDMEVFLDKPDYRRKPTLSNDEIEFIADYRQLKQPMQQAMRTLVKNPPTPLSEDEQRFLTLYRTLNAKGQETAQATLKGMTFSPDFAK